MDYRGVVPVSNIWVWHSRHLICDKAVDEYELKRRLRDIVEAFRRGQYDHLRFHRGENNSARPSDLARRRQPAGRSLVRIGSRGSGSVQRGDIRADRQGSMGGTGELLGEGSLPRRNLPRPQPTCFRRRRTAQQDQTRWEVRRYSCVYTHRLHSGAGVPSSGVLDARRNLYSETAASGQPATSFRVLFRASTFCSKQ